MSYTPAKKPRKEELELCEVALAYPEATEDFPWGHRALKVKGKTFAWMGTAEDGSFFFTAKLPTTNGMALMLPFASPAGYGLARSGWVSAAFQKGEAIPVGLLKEWLDESYRAVAPKTLVKALDGAAPTPTKAAAKKAAPKKKPAAKKKVAPKKKVASKKAAAKKKASARR